jgi:hypothetical protein
VIAKPDTAPPDWLELAAARVHVWTSVTATKPGSNFRSPQEADAYWPENQTLTLSVDTSSEAPTPLIRCLVPPLCGRPRFRPLHTRERD